MLNFVRNSLNANCRIKQLEGRDYLVAPMVMITNGVHAGSKGAMYYPHEELAKAPETWNHKPVVVYHPTVNGQHVSACDPDIMTTYKVGMIFNTQYDRKEGKLRAEAWLEEARLREVDVRVLNALDDGTPMEVSTGLYTDEEAEAGVWNAEENGGEEYEYVARNLRPDHLALLPDKKGACSIDDGAGLLMNQLLVNSPKDIAAELGVSESVVRRLMLNELSHENIYSAIATQLHEKLEDAWVVDVYDSFFIYNYDGMLWSLGYTRSGDNVTLTAEDPVRVQRVTEYRTLDGAFVGNNNTENNAMPKRTLNELVEAVIANSNNTFTANDTQALTAMGEETLAKLLPEEGGEEDAAAAADTQAAPAQTPETQAAPAANAGAKQVPAVNEWLAQMPPEFSEVFGEMRDATTAERQRLVSTITANANNTFTEAQLGEMPLVNLRAIAAVAAPTQQAPVSPRAAVYAGAPGYVEAPTANAAEAEEPLEIPVMNFAGE